MSRKLPSATPRRPSLWFLLGVLAGQLLAPATSLAQPVATPPPAAGATLSTPIIAMRDVRPGMRGYGMTVFHGITVEPFPVEVVSVMSDFGPRLGIVWIRCPDERMQLSGPVAGMSGSPIYLWSDDEPHELGRGGRLLGAFAYGYNLSKDCYVGVQPIEQMLPIAERDDGRTLTPSDPDRPSPGSRPAGSLTAGLTQLLDAQPKTANNFKARLLAQILAPQAPPAAEADGSRTVAGPPGIPGSPARLMLPLAVPSADLADLLRPLLASTGLIPVAAPGDVAGAPPFGIDPKAIPMVPGGILSIPLVWGDVDFSALGTITAVLDDGSVLAFGHAMDALGPRRLPVASGFVHFIQPLVTSSFKVGGSGALYGTLVRDEATGIYCRPGIGYETIDMTVRVKHPNQEEKTYHYQGVRDRDYAPAVLGVAAAQSLIAQYTPSPENTVVMSGSVTYDGGRTLRIREVLPEATSADVTVPLVQPTVALIDNPFQVVLPRSLDLSIEVLPGVESAELLDAQPDALEVYAGRALGITLRLKPFRQAPRTMRVEMPIPADLPPGEYEIRVGSAESFARQLIASRAHLSLPRNIDDLFASLQTLTAVPADELYLTMSLPTQGMSIGSTELPNLPSSRAALLEPLIDSAQAGEVRSFQTRRYPLGLVVGGAKTITIQVRSPDAPAGEHEVQTHLPDGGEDGSPGPNTPSQQPSDHPGHQES
ncbi:MAG: hypothetical protein IT442_06920 [Phycisphaeraceae bacterium]|nr:hypothetical protein [Phycisphaeraceae bacterium]